MVPGIDTPRMVSASVIIGLVGLLAAVGIVVHDGSVSEELTTGVGATAATLWACVALSCGVLHRVSADRRAIHLACAAFLVGLSVLATGVLIAHSATAAASAMLLALPAVANVTLLVRCPEIDTSFSARRCAAISLAAALVVAVVAAAFEVPTVIAAVAVFVAWAIAALLLVRSLRRAGHLNWWIVISGHGTAIAAGLQIDAAPEGVLASSALSAVIAAFALGGVVVEVRRAYADQQRGAVAALAEAAVATMRAQAVEDIEAERLHEARAALAGIGAAAESLARYRDLLEPQQFDDLSTGMVHEVSRLKGLIAHDAVTSVVPSLDVVAAIRPAVTCARATGLEITGHLPPGILARSSPDVLAQVVTALLANVARHAPGSPVDVSVGRRGATVVVTVADRGPGISEHDCERIFSRGVSTSSTGLGLYLARSQLSAIGASITASPRIGGGAMFRVTVPVADDARRRNEDLRSELRVG